MKPYACYPRVRTRFATPAQGFIHPFYHTSGHQPGPKGSLTNKPAANILRTEGAYQIQLAVPGLTRDQIKIELADGQLHVSGPAANEAADVKYIRREFNPMGFKRTFRLHKNADTAAMSATFDQGMLVITIPDATPETIKINIQ